MAAEESRSDGGLKRSEKAWRRGCEQTLMELGWGWCEEEDDGDEACSGKKDHMALGDQKNQNNPCLG